MAYLPEEKGWGPGVFQIETNTPWVGGLEGNCNKQALELIKRLNYLKDYANEIAAARGGKNNLNARLDQYDVFEPENIAALYIFVTMGLTWPAWRTGRSKKRSPSVFSPAFPSSLTEE